MIVVSFVVMTESRVLLKGDEGGFVGIQAEPMEMRLQVINICNPHPRAIQPIFGSACTVPLPILTLLSPSTRPHVTAA